MHPILFEIGPFTVRYYGLMYVIAIVVGIFLTYREVKRRGMELKLDDILDFVLLAVPLGIVLARIYYVLFRLEHYIDEPLDIFKLWEGGLAIHGGLIGGALALFIFSRWKKISLWGFADCLALSMILGTAIGRFGNFMNGDAFGVPFAARTIMRWPWLEFFIFKPGTPAALEYGGKPLHPAMLYELLGCLIIFGFLWWLRGGNYKEGFLISVYLISYSVLRFGVEFFRGDSLWLVPDMVKAAWVISFLIVLSFSWLIYRKRLWQPVAAPKPRPKAKPKPKLKEGS